MDSFAVDRYVVEGADTAVVVAPGGGYAQLSVVREGIEVAEWLNTIGISAFLLK